MLTLSIFLNFLRILVNCIRYNPNEIRSVHMYATKSYGAVEV